MAGFSQGGGVGLVLSRWMTEGDPGQDVIAMDVARYGHFATPAYTRTKVIENYRRRFRLARPNEELPAARPLRRTPIYAELKARGAVFGANFGLENALWFATGGAEAVEHPTYRRSNAMPFVKAECDAVRTAVGLYETSNYGKYEVTGKGARAWLDRVFACRIPKPGAWASRPCSTGRGGSSATSPSLAWKRAATCCSARASSRPSTCAGSSKAASRTTCSSARRPRR